MPGLYNLFFGENKQADVLLAALGLTRDSVGRYRDCYIENGEIALYTRNGCNNREHWEFSFAEYQEGEDCPCPGCVITYQLPKHPCYLRDQDDDFDATYATVYFRFPEEYKVELEAISAETTVAPSKKWKSFIQELSKKE